MPKKVRIGLSHGDDEHYGNYPQALKRVGATLGLDVETIWLSSPGSPIETNSALDLDGIVFTGGDDIDPARYGRADARDLCEIDPKRDAFEWALVEGTAHLPLLAICRGSQLLNVYHGGSLVPHLATAQDHVRHEGLDSEHPVTVAPNSVLEAMAAGDPRTNSSHHQGVDRLADPFKPLAHAPDGTLEAYGYADPAGLPFFLATQWHPERMPERTLGDNPIAGFLRAASGDHIGF
jgi:putative glutamine amidotransferase